MQTTKQNLQTRSKNALSELGEKIFLDRYAFKDGKKETLAVGDTVIVCVNLKTGQREIGAVESIDKQNRQVSVRLRDGAVEHRHIDHVDKPLETVPEQMFDRVAKHIASVEQTSEKRAEWEKHFRELVDDWKYVPAGRIFTAAGTGQALTYYNCYVIPCPEDSRGGIFKTLADMAELMSRSGGVGINASSLRPRYAYVKGVNGRSSGAVSWASLYSFVTGLIEQGGSRRGALMLILNVWHPDVLEFINSKREAGKITNANISVGITDDFMEAVKQDRAWDLVFPDVSDPLYHERWQECQGDIRVWKQMGGKVVTYKTVRARDMWDQIVSSAWASAEPGMYFVDRANYYSNSHYFAPLPCTNPCGEQPLPPWGVCNLGHVNLAKHVNSSGTDVDWNLLRDTVQKAVRFQDNVIDATPYFFEENKKQQFSERRIGMGTIGLAEMMIKLGVKYGSPKSAEFIDKLYQFIAVTAYEASVGLAKEKGAFLKFDVEKFLQSGFMKGMPEYIRRQVAEHGIRNVTILTQAPTGTVGTMVGTSTGIEPFYSWTYFRKARLGVHEEKIKVAQQWLDAHPGQELPDYFVNALELTPEEHVRVQAAVQRWTDSAISKTCNAPATYTIEQTKQLYELMYELGCKGGTIYRDASRDEQILATDTKNLGKDVVEQLEKNKLKVGSAEIPGAVVGSGVGAGAGSEAPGLNANNAAREKEAKSEKEMALAHVQGNSILQVDSSNPDKIVVKQLIQNGTRYEIVPRTRPKEMQGVTYKTNTPYGNLYVTINSDQHGPFEVFAQLGLAGGFFSALSEAICRLISLNLRSGVSVNEVIKQLKGIRSSEVAFSDGEMVYSLPDAIGKVLEKHVNKSQQKLRLEFKEKQEIKAEQIEGIAGKAEPQITGQITEEVREVIAEKVVHTGEGTAFTMAQKISIANLGYAPVCPTCSGMLIMQEGCLKCNNCGYSKCG